MKKSTGRKVFEVFNITFMIIILVVSVYPILNQVALSLSGSSAIIHGRVTIFPVDITLNTYKSILKEQLFRQDYLNTLIYTTSGTVVSLALTTIASYALSKKIVGGKTILFIFIFTMFFGAGLIPSYLWIKKLNIDNTIWAIILPNCILPYHILLMKTFFQGLPTDLEEAAKIDGVSQFGYFCRIALPLSKPILATMTLFISVIYWNDWFTALIYLDDSTKYPVTLYLRNVMMGATMASQNGQTMDATVKSVPQSVQAASMLLVILPILCVYPKVQKYFVKGIMIGAVKG